jgi:REP element-mobilizing transposase RayT
VWAKNPVYFLTTCTHKRLPLLTNTGVSDLIIDSWHASPKINGWFIGRYVVMPDHVHFFAQSGREAKSLPSFMRDWKRWIAGEIQRVHPVTPPVWQSEFFDHVLRSTKSYDQKWAYVRENPVRAGLAATPDNWPHSGECETLLF